MTGTVRSSSGSALNGASVRVADGPNAGQSTFTNTSGIYSLTGLTFAGFTITVAEPGFISSSQGVSLTSGVTTLTLNFTLTPSGPAAVFSDGQFLVGKDIAAGRYYSDPPTGCYFERESGLGGSLGEIIANNFLGFDAGQWIVDISASDKAFKSTGCGAWSLSPRAASPPAGTIRPGLWVVGSQIAAGTYRVNAGAGCYWERVRDFSADLRSIIANNFSSSAGQQLVSISGSDAGFDGDADCGTWATAANVTSFTPTPPPLMGTLEAREAMRAAKWPGHVPRPWR